MSAVVVTFGGMLRFAALDIETRVHLPLARDILHLDPQVPDADVRARLTERRRAESYNGSDFQKLPYHEPVSSAVLLAERASDSPDAPLLATEWSCWRTGDVPTARFVERFFESLAGRTYVGFNSQNFDLPLMELWASRCMVAAPLHFSADASGARRDGPRNRQCSAAHCDVQKELVNWASGSGTLDELCKFHGLPGKPGISGNEVESLLRSERLDELQAYNVTDVLQTWLLFLHLEVRRGRLTRGAASRSAHSALDLTRDRVAAWMPESSEARALLERSIEACRRAPIAG